MSVLCTASVRFVYACVWYSLIKKKISDGRIRDMKKVLVFIACVCIIVSLVTVICFAVDAGADVGMTAQNTVETGVTAVAFSQPLIVILCILAILGLGAYELNHKVH